MSVSQIMNGSEVSLRVIPDLRPLGYTNERAGLETEHVSITKHRLQQLEDKVEALETLTARLLARLTYAEGFLQMIDEAIAVEGFPGWSPPE
jgi:hypothetical protein